MIFIILLVTLGYGLRQVTTNSTNCFMVSENVLLFGILVNWYLCGLAKSLRTRKFINK